MGVTTVVFVLMAFKAAHEKRKVYFLSVHSKLAAHSLLAGGGSPASDCTRFVRGIIFFSCGGSCRAARIQDTGRCSMWCRRSGGGIGGAAGWWFDEGGVGGEVGDDGTK